MLNPVLNRNIAIILIMCWVRSTGCDIIVLIIMLSSLVGTAYDIMISIMTTFMSNVYEIGNDIMISII